MWSKVCFRCVSRACRATREYTVAVAGASRPRPCISATLPRCLYIAVRNSVARCWVISNSGDVAHRNVQLNTLGAVFGKTNPDMLVFADAEGAAAARKVLLGGECKAHGRFMSKGGPARRTAGAPLAACTVPFAGAALPIEDGRIVCVLDGAAGPGLPEELPAAKMQATCLVRVLAASDFFFYAEAAAKRSATGVLLDRRRAPDPPSRTVPGGWHQGGGTVPGEPIARLGHGEVLRTDVAALVVRAVRASPDSVLQSHPATCTFLALHADVEQPGSILTWAAARTLRREAGDALLAVAGAGALCWRGAGGEATVLLFDRAADAEPASQLVAAEGMPAAASFQGALLAWSGGLAWRQEGGTDVTVLLSGHTERSRLHTLAADAAAAAVLGGGGPTAIALWCRQTEVLWVCPKKAKSVPPMPSKPFLTPLSARALLRPPSTGAAAPFPVGRRAGGKTPSHGGKQWRQAAVRLGAGGPRRCRWRCQR